MKRKNILVQSLFKKRSPPPNPLHAVLGSFDRRFVPQPSHKPTDTAHGCTNDAGDAKLEWRSFDIIEIYKQPKTVEIAGPKADHHVVPVCASRQLIEKQIDPQQDQEFKDTKGREGNEQSGRHT